MKKILLLCCVTMSIPLFAATYQVGTGKTYASPNALYLADVVSDGDIIEIDAETYTGTAALAVWMKNNLIIRGVGGRPHLVADGQYIWGKGIWVFAGNDITVENIEFSEASVPDQNGAGIRLDGVGMTARYCYFHDNEDGILTSNPGTGNILIEYCEFGYNGFGDGQSHNLYVGKVDQLIFRYNYSHHAKVGHNLKSRASENIIVYNRIMDQDTGRSSRLIDLPNGGKSLIMGNLLMQGPNAENKNLIGFGLEGLNNPAPHEIYVTNNTVVNKRTASPAVFLDFPTINFSLVSNNIFAAVGVIATSPISDMQANLIESEIADVLLTDEANYDYTLQATSPAADMGANLGSMGGYLLTPEHSYLHVAQEAGRSIANGQIDIGAYERDGMTTSNADVTLDESCITLHPNPTPGLFTVTGNLGNFDIDILNSNGTVYQQLSGNTELTVDLSALPNGLYYIRIVKGNPSYNGNLYMQKILKQ